MAHFDDSESLRKSLPCEAEDNEDYVNKICIAKT